MLLWLRPELATNSYSPSPVCISTLAPTLLDAGLVSGVVLDVPGDRSAELLKTSTEDGNTGLGFQISGK